MDNKLTKILTIINGPFALAIFTFCGYVFTYNFNVGFLNYYDIPPQFVELNLTKVILVTGASVSSFLLLIPSIEVLLSPGKGKKVIGNTNIIVTGLGVLLILQIVIYRFDWSNYQWLLLIFVGVIVLGILYNVSTPVHKLIRWFFNPSSVFGFTSFFKNYLGIPLDKIYLFIFIIVVIAQVFFSSGYLYASKIKSFNTIDIHGQSYAVIDIYQNKLLLMPIDTKKKEITKQLHVYSIDGLGIGKTSLLLTKTNALHFSR